MNRKSFMRAIAIALLSDDAVSAAASEQSQMPTTTTNAVHVQYKTVGIDGLDILYREAGPSDAPVVLLLHGFPTSSHMFRNLIPALADKFRVVAPDYPGFGNSSMPTVDQNTCSPVSAPINQNGRARANSNRKNVDTDPLGGAAVSTASSDQISTAARHSGAAG